MRTCSSAAGSIASNLNFRIKTRTTRKCSLLQKSAHITRAVMKKKFRIFAQSSPRRFYVLLRNNPNKLLYCNYIAMHILLLILGLAKSALCTIADKKAITYNGKIGIFRKSIVFTVKIQNVHTKKWQFKKKKKKKKDLFHFFSSLFVYPTSLAANECLFAL